MGIENFLKRWTIRESDTDVITVSDKLRIDRVGKSPKVKFRCRSPNSGTSERWDDVKDCRWRENGGPAGHLQGTISDASGDSFPLAITYAENSPNRIHIEIIAMPVRGGRVVALIAGGAGGDDD